MTNSISFPNMPIIGDTVFEINRVAFTVFGREIMWYGIIIAVGFIIAALYFTRRATQFNSNSDQLIDLLIFALPLSIIGARAYYVAFEWDRYKDNLSDIFAIWNGGLAIYGAIITAFIVAFVFCKIKKADLLSILDVGMLGMLIGQFIGRWANFINAEAFGGTTDLPWGMVINNAAAVHPTFLYESIWNFVGFIILHFYSKRRKFRGEITLLYVAWYGLGRAFIEGLRTDSLYIGETGIRMSQLFAAVTFLLAAAALIYFYATKKYPKPFVVSPAKAEKGAEIELSKQKLPEQQNTEKELNDERNID